MILSPMEKKIKRKWNGKNMRQKDEIITNLDLNRPVYLLRAGRGLFSESSVKYASVFCVKLFTFI